MTLAAPAVAFDTAKYSHMDEAQRRIQSLQRTLSRFRAELADVSIQADLQLQVERL